MAAAVLEAKINTHNYINWMVLMMAFSALRMIIGGRRGGCWRTRTPFDDMAR